MGSTKKKKLLLPRQKVRKKKMASFGADKYRYTLHSGGALALSKSAYISALHKTDRNDMSQARAFHVQTFFSPVKREAAIPSTLAGGITNQINRFAIAVFEEGSFLHLCDEMQTVLVDCLLDAQAHRKAGTEGLREESGQGRQLTSAASRPTRRGAPRPTVAQSPTRRPRNGNGCVESSRRRKPRRVCARRRRALPTAVRLMDRTCDRGAELRRVIYMNAIVAGLVHDDARRAVPDAPLDCGRIEPSMQTWWISAYSTACEASTMRKPGTSFSTAVVASSTRHRCASLD